MVMNRKKQDLFEFLGILCAVLIINYIGSKVFKRFDLTKEGRYSLSVATKDLLKTVDDYIYIEVFLEGEFPAGIERLSNETKQLLSEYKSFNELIQFTFINPTESTDSKTRNEIITQLYEKGLDPTSLQVKEGDSYIEKIIVPGAIVKYGAKEIAVQLLKNQLTASPDQNIEISIQELEYEFTNAIKRLKTPIKPTIAFLSGHGELEDKYIEDLNRSLSTHYSVEQIDLREFEVDSQGNPDLVKKLNSIKRTKLLMIAKPQNEFQNLDKYLIDQYIMSGGKVVWLLDATNADMDSLSNKGSFLAHPQRELNIGDQLFKYGVRINGNIVADISCSKIPIPVSFINDIPQWELMPWRFFPISIPTSNHPITTNLNAVKFDFASSIDTVKTNSKIQKTILLTSSPYSKTLNTPYEISLQEALEQPVQEEYSEGPQNLAVLLEGEFESIFKNRISQLNSKLPFKPSSSPTKMIIISDGDLIKNRISRGNALPLGYDNYEKINYGNKDFILNVIDYLLEDEDLIRLRSRELKMRLLDPNKVLKDRSFWQIINLTLPIVLMIILGIIFRMIRLKKYTYEK